MRASRLLWLALAIAAGPACAPSRGPDPSAGEDVALVEVGEIRLTLADLRARWAVGRASGGGEVDARAGRELLRAMLSEMAVDAVLLDEARRRDTFPTEADVRREAEQIRAGDPTGYDATLAAFPGGESAYLRFLAERLARERVEIAVRAELRARAVPDPAAVARRVRELTRQAGASVPPRVRIAQVLAGSAAAAEQARGRLLAGEPVEKVARELSIAPEAAAGGDLGWRAPGSLPPFMEAVAFRLEEGQVSEILPSPYGWHVMVALDREPGGPPDPGRLKARAIADLIAEEVDRAWARWLEERMRQAGVRIGDAAARVRCCRDGWPYLADSAQAAEAAVEPKGGSPAGAPPSPDLR